MKTLKYVRHSIAGFVVWPKNDNQVHHAHVGQALARNPALDGGEVMSAGFIDFIRGLPVCYGRSESMDVDSLPGDTAALLAEWGMSAVAPVQKQASETAGVPA